MYSFRNVIKQTFNRNFWINILLKLIIEINCLSYPLWTTRDWHKESWLPLTSDMSSNSISKQYWLLERHNPKWHYVESCDKESFGQWKSNDNNSRRKAIQMKNSWFLYHQSKYQFCQHYMWIGMSKWNNRVLQLDEKKLYKMKHSFSTTKWCQQNGVKLSCYISCLHLASERFIKIQ